MKSLIEIFRKIFNKPLPLNGFYTYYTNENLYQYYQANGSFHNFNYCINDVTISHFERVYFTENANTIRIDHFGVPCKLVRKGNGTISLQAFARFVKKNFPSVDQIELDMKVGLDPTSKNSRLAWEKLFEKIGTEQPTSNNPKHINAVWKKSKWPQ